MMLVFRRTFSPHGMSLLIRILGVLLMLPLALLGACLNDSNLIPSEESAWQPLLTAGAFAAAIAFSAFFLWQFIAGRRARKHPKDIAGLVPESLLHNREAREDYPQYEYIRLTSAEAHEADGIVIGEKVRAHIDKVSASRRPGERHYMLYHFDSAQNMNRAAGIVTVTVLDDVISVSVIQEKKMESRRLPERFIIDEVAARRLGGCIWRRQAGGYLFDMRYVNPRRMHYLLPNYIEVGESAGHESLVARAKTEFGIDVTQPRYLYLVQNNYRWHQKREMFAAACAFSPVYHAMQLWCFVEAFIDQLITGLALAAILYYVQDLGVLDIYEWIIYIAEVVVVSIFISPIFAKIVAKIVLEGRDIRIAERGHLWDRKIQHQRATIKLMRNLCACAFLKTVSVVLFFMLVPRASFAGAPGARLLFHFADPTVYLALYVGWWFFDSIVKDYETEFFAEVEHRSLAANIEAREKGFSAVDDIIANFRLVLTRAIGAAGLLLGIAIIGIGAAWLIVPLLVAASAVYIVQGFIFPLYARDYRLFLDLPGAHHMVLPNGDFKIGDTVRLRIRSLDPELHAVAPMKTDETTSRLAWLERLDARLLFQAPPSVARRGSRYAFKDASGTSVEFGRVLGKAKPGEDFVVSGNEIILCPQARQAALANNPFGKYFDELHSPDLFWLLYTFQGGLGPISVRSLMRNFYLPPNRQEDDGARTAEIELILSDHLDLFAESGYLTRQPASADAFDTAYGLASAYLDADPTSISQTMLELRKRR